MKDKISKRGGGPFSNIFQKSCLTDYLGNGLLSYKKPQIRSNNFRQKLTHCVPYQRLINYKKTFLIQTHIRWTFCTVFEFCTVHMVTLLFWVRLEERRRVSLEVITLYACVFPFFSSYTTYKWHFSWSPLCLPLHSFPTHWRWLGLTWVNNLRVAR